MREFFANRLKNQVSSVEGRASARMPTSPADLMLRMVNYMVDSYLELRRLLTKQLGELQEQLFGVRGAPGGWRLLLDSRNALHLLEDTCEDQRAAITEWIDALEEWARGDRRGAAARARAAARALARRPRAHRARPLARAPPEASSETAVQMHFSEQSNRTNAIMRMLTTLTAIFLPLNLVTGFFGMNFEGLPLIHSPTGFWIIFLVMLALGVGMSIYFWRKRYLGAPERRLPNHFAFSRQQYGLLVFLTIVWGINWPMMKLGVTGYPPLGFRALSMWLGLPVLWAVLRLQRVSFVIRRDDWPELAKLSINNMIIWHVLAILAVQALSSGRAAILGYTMPIFSAIYSVVVLGERLRPRHVAGIVAAALGVSLLLWHEFATIAGKPLAAIGMLVAAAVWAVGTQQMRRTTIAAPTLAIVFWMTLSSTLVMTTATVLFERDRWAVPGAVTLAAVGYNAVLIFGLAQPVWLILARALPPIASSMSVMMIPVLGTIIGALWLGEALHWQDGAAIVLVLLAIASVMWPTRVPARRVRPRSATSDAAGQPA